MLSEQKMKNVILAQSRKTGLPPQQLYGLFGLEQLLKKLSKTIFREHLILKGGYLLATTYGLTNRVTRDLDTTMRGLALTQEKVNELVELIVAPDEQGKQYFFLKSIRPSREEFEYNGFNLKLLFQNGRSKFPLDIDITTGEDLIEVNERNEIPLLFENGTLNFPSYPLEQILADKFYTMLAYGTDGTRMKDYYDMYILPRLATSVDYVKVDVAIRKTAAQRNLAIDFQMYQITVRSIENSNFQRERWMAWKKEIPYAQDIEFEEVIDGLKKLMENLKANATNTKEI
jgi:predicted nucleotidyltransferase component of viral defense system